VQGSGRVGKLGFGGAAHERERRAVKQRQALDVDPARASQVQELVPRLKGLRHEMHH